MCAFPKGAHDDDVDATSQALIYMRSRLGGGIVDFYRQQATGEIASSASACFQRKTHGSARQRAASPLPASTIEDSTLARRVLAAVLRVADPMQCQTISGDTGSVGQRCERIRRHGVPSFSGPKRAGTSGSIRPMEAAIHNSLPGIIR
jgi:hypothetical protein